MAVIYIENRPYEAHDGKNLLAACLSLGFDIPYFCWHPALGSVGACRQCAVKKYRDENDTSGRIVMSCMEPVADGLRISINDPEVKRFRAGVIEWLMTSHPHDCPVCDEGGECHLQDMTVMTGHDYRRYRFNKRTHNNQYLGPFVNHEMNRCIQCYRCVRFYRDYAGGRDFHVLAAHHHVYFGRHEDGILESEFSGNLAEICPTGVFTDKTLHKHYTRKWDLQSAASVCVHCGLGCNTFIGMRYGTLRRILNRYNGTVNGYFLCDRGRFGYEFVNSGKRICRIQIRSGKSGLLEPADKQAGLLHVNEITREGGIIGIGSPRASVESNFALRKLVGRQNFYSGMSAREHNLLSLIIRVMGSGAAFFPSLKECEKADAVLVLGEDVVNTAPLLALALKQAVKNKALRVLEKKSIHAWDSGSLCEIVEEEAGPLFVACPLPTKLDDAATRVYRGTPADIARLGFAIAQSINPGLPPVPGLMDEDKKLAEEIASTLRGAFKPLVVSGTGCLSEPVVEAAANIARALSDSNPGSGLFLAVPECNSFGLALLGGLPLDEAFHRAGSGNVKAAIILENDLYRRAEKRHVDQFLTNCGHVILLDSIDTATTVKADIIFPAASFAEADGTLVNNEGRAQRFYRVMEPPGDVLAGWRWLSDIMRNAGSEEANEWKNLDDIVAALVSEMPALHDMKNITLPSGYRINGQRIPRQPHRYSGRTAMEANVDVHERKPPPDFDSPLSFSMEGFRGEPPSPVIPFYWRPGWNSVQSLNKFQAEIGALYGGDPGRRILAPSPDAFAYFKQMPQAETLGRDELLFVPYRCIYGGEELSSLSPAIAERISGEFLYINEIDARQIGVGDESPVHISLSDTSVTLAVKISADIPKGTACYPVGLPGFTFIDLPVRGTIKGAG